MKNSSFDEGLKRFVDLVLGSAALLLFLPFIALTGLAVLIVDGRPVLFRQVRVGRDGRLFTMPKFRTMRDELDSEGKPLPDEARTTRLGRFLRRSRLDDLLGILPVLSGDMSLVGPRPLPPYILDGLTAREERSRQRPGLTGLAQVSGSTLLTNKEKFALDIYYGHNRSFWMDMVILLRTVATLIRERRDEAQIRRALDYCAGLDGEAAALAAERAG